MIKIKQLLVHLVLLLNSIFVIRPTLKTPSAENAKSMKKDVILTSRKPVKIV